MSLKKWFGDRHKRRIEIMKEDSKHIHHFYPIIPLTGIGFFIFLGVIAYGLVVAPCSFEATGKITGRLDAENPIVSNDIITITSFEGSISGSGPCLAVLSTGFNLKQTTPPIVPAPSIPHSSQSFSTGGM